MTEERRNWNPGLANGDCTIGEVLATLPGDEPQSIPWSVRLFENPGSPLALPGNTTLERHDPLHVLLGRGITIWDEAFVLGVTMGAARNVRTWHLHLYLWWVSCITPEPFHFDAKARKAFWLGVKMARDLNLRNLDQVLLEEMVNQKVSAVRRQLGIRTDYLKQLYATEPSLQIART